MSGYGDDIGMFGDFFRYWDELPEQGGFSLFGWIHMGWLVGIVSVCLVVSHRYRRVDAATQDKILKILATASICLESLKDIYLILIGEMGISYLPFEMCGLAIFVELGFAFFHREFLGEIMCVISMPGAMAALLFPDWTRYPLFNYMHINSFMKLSAASIMTASVALNFGNTAFAATASENPKDVLKNFFESFSPTDHESWVNYFASSVYGYYRQFAQNAFNQAKRLGLLDINKAELLYAEKVNNVYAPKYYEFNQYYDSGTNYACYKTITDMETETGEYFGNGTNFSLVLMIREASGWKIGGICKCPRDLGSVPAGITVSRQSYGFVSYQSQPSYIKVKDENGTVKNVAFSTYLKNVTYNEIGNMGYYDEAIKANVMAIKMCGWWAHAAGYRSAEGCDIKYGDVAYKSSYQTKPAITNAINAVDGKKLVSSGGQLFFTSYFAGSSDTAGKNSGRLRQNGSNYLASTKSYTYTEILHYYYDNSSYNNPSVGIVKIN